jgi:putative FmdB family regulatory protein
MPTYDYRCARCGHEFELFQSITEKPKSRCPKCKGKLKRLIGTGAGLLFKGSGFYQTDYRSEGYKRGAKEESGGGEASSGGKDDAAKAEPGKAEPAKDAKGQKAPKEKKPKSSGTGA